MNELTTKIKKELIKQLTQNEQIADHPHLYRGQKVLTRREIAKEIEDETTEGIGIMTSVLTLALDLIARKKDK